MVGREDELELSLKMGFPSPYPSPSPLDLSLNPSNGPRNQSKAKPFFLLSPAAGSYGMRSSLVPLMEIKRNSETRSLIGGIDVNQAPPYSAAEMDEEYWISSPNSTVSSAISAGKRAEREVAVENENDGERTSCSRGSDDEDVGAGEGEGTKKLRLTREQALVLEETFKEHSTLNPKQKLALADQLNLRPRQVEVWFQNRRARTKLKQTEVDCEYLKKCCENLTQENRRLHKEVEELRALKLSPHLYMHMTPPTTLTMCPSCQRLASSNNMARPAETQSINNPWAALQQHSFNPQNPY